MSAPFIPHVEEPERPVGCFVCMFQLQPAEFSAVARLQVRQMGGWFNSPAIQLGRAGLRPARLYSRRAAAPRAGYAVSSFGNDPSRGRGRGEPGPGG
ncbi:MAG: hypothetical protein AB7I34_22970 [Rhizobiaceae bacterium]